MRKYIGLLPYIPDGEYRVFSNRYWHERIRVRLAALLLRSVPVVDVGFEIKTRAGTSQENQP